MEEGDGTNSEITLFSSLSSSTRSQSETKDRKFSNFKIKGIKSKNCIHLTDYLVLLICAFCIVSITGPEIFKAKNIPGLDRKCTAFQDNIHQMLSKFKTRHANAFCYSNGTFQKY
ncbi:MAG: hypothetical protein MHPSP_003327, partial [Paramarteilia canceri]